MAEAYDNGGFRTSFDVNASQPVITQTAQRITNAVKDTDTEVTVTPGARYKLTASAVGGFYCGLADVTTAANVRWVCSGYASCEIQIPIGYTTLHYAADTNSAVGYLIEIKQASNIEVTE